MLLLHMPQEITELTKKYPAVSEYITQIYLILRDYSYCNNRRLSLHIGVSASAVTQAVLRLKKLGLALQDTYGMIMLTPKGTELAEELLRRHYLLEYLMVKKLNFPWELADDEAGHLQDKVSPDFINHLNRELGSPRTCPHGNPFPDNPDAEKILAAPGLTSMEPGDLVEVVRITEEGERIDGLLHACFEIGVMPGNQYIIEEFDDVSVHLASENTGKTYAFDLRFAEHIKVYRKDST
jgi:DtxR family transcriptional regulator, Mn-dependent transcriptional regulator